MELAARRKGPAYVLSPEQIRRAHELIKSGVTLAQVARTYGVTRQTIYYSIARENGGAYGGVQADIAAMKLELTELRAWRDQMLACAPSGEQVAAS